MLQIELEPEVERRLIEKARAIGLEPEAYASQLITTNVPPSSEKRLSQQEIEGWLSRIASHGHKLPNLPDEAYTRESFYQDHD